MSSQISQSRITKDFNYCQKLVRIVKNWQELAIFGKIRHELARTVNNCQDFSGFFLMKINSQDNFDSF